MSGNRAILKAIMKNFLYIVIGLAVIVGVGYSVFNNPSGTLSDQRSDSVVSNAADDGSYTAGAYQDYSQAAYKQALADGKTVILDFHADWCSTCVQNKKIIDAAFESNTNTNLVGFQVNYDVERELKRAFNVTIQGMIIQLDAGGEIGRLGPNPITAEQFAVFIKE